MRSHYKTTLSPRLVIKHGFAVMLCLGFSAVSWAHKPSFSVTPKGEVKRPICDQSLMKNIADVLQVNRANSSEALKSSQFELLSRHVRSASLLHRNKLELTAAHQVIYGNAPSMTLRLQDPHYGETELNVMLVSKGGERQFVIRERIGGENWQYVCKQSFVDALNRSLKQRVPALIATESRPQERELQIRKIQDREKEPYKRFGQKLFGKKKNLSVGAFSSPAAAADASGQSSLIGVDVSRDLKDKEKKSFGRISFGVGRMDYGESVSRENHSMGVVAVSINRNPFKKKKNK